MKWMLRSISFTIAASLMSLGMTPAQGNTVEVSEMDEREEINQTHNLDRGASVEIKGINGPVEIQTSNTNTAQIQIVRTAKSRADLETRKIVIEYQPSSLVIRGENAREREEDGGSVRDEVKLNLPRQISLTTRGINGPVNVGQVNGPIKLSGINGMVTVTEAAEYSDISGINGGVTLTMAHLGDQGIKISGVNGRVELRFAQTLNARLEVTGINGKVYPEVPNVTVEGEVSRTNFRAQIGSGGPLIKVSGVNGQVRLRSASNPG